MLMSLKNQPQQQTLQSPSSPEQESYQCHETISDISLEINQQNQPTQCHCTCRCKNKSLEDMDPKQRKRLKRKNNKQKMKNKQKEIQQKALRDLEQTIQDIYALKTDYNTSKNHVKACFAVDINRQKFYQFINSVIRDEVEVNKIQNKVIRKLIAEDLLLLSSKTQQSEKELIKNIFQKIKIVRTASPEIQKIINLFASIHFDSRIEDPPYQKNLDQMTLRFLIKNYLKDSKTFILVCEIIFQNQQYSSQRELFQIMMNAYNKSDPQDSQQQDYSDSQYESDEWSQECKQQLDISTSQQGQSRSKKRRQRRKRLKQQYQQNQETVIKRMQAMNINQHQRLNCNVQESWIQDMIKKRQHFLQNTLTSFNRK